MVADRTSKDRRPDSNDKAKGLSDRKLKSLRPAPKGTRYEIKDSVVPGLIVRVTDKGRKTLMLKTRFHKGGNPTRRSLGQVGAITLKAARELARDWHEKIRRGIDPADEIREAAKVRKEKKQTTFAKVAEEYLKQRVIGPDESKPLQRRAREVSRQIRTVFIAAWGNRPITDISRDDVEEIIGARKKTPATARNLLAAIRSLFVWATHHPTYRKSLKLSPCAGIKPSYLIGEASKRDRVLSDNELRLLVRNVDRLRYPYGAIYRMLLLTALRRNEVALAHWREFNLADKEWIIPAARMKGKNTKAVPHLVPITDDIKAVLDSVPRFNKGQFLFSTTAGEKPIATWSKIKDELDMRMLRTLKASMRMRGDRREVAIPHWVNHDIRRTVRTRLAAIPNISEETREAVMAHVKPGIKQTYNVYEYRGEKRDALERWAARLKQITHSPLGDLSEFFIDLDG